MHYKLHFIIAQAIMMEALRDTIRVIFIGSSGQHHVPSGGE
jgi:hypothetical protein